MDTTTQSLKRRKRLALAGILSGPTIFLFVFFLCPLLIMLVYSWLQPGMYGGVEKSFSHLNYGRIFGWADTRYEKYDPVYITIFINSVKLAGITVLLSLLLCYPMALWVARLPEQKKKFVIFLITLPFFISLIVRLFAWILILRPIGLLNQLLIGMGLIDTPLEMIFTNGAVIVGMVYVFIPFMFLPLYASIDKLDPGLLEASQDLGGNTLQTFFRVVLPLTLPGIVGGCIIVFIPSLGNFIVPSLLGGAKVVMIGNLVEQQFLSARNWPFGAALGMMVMGAVLVLMLFYVRLMTRSEEQQTQLPVSTAGDDS